MATEEKKFPYSLDGDALYQTYREQYAPGDRPAYAGTWDQPMEELYGRLTSRPAFSYNAGKDPLYQQYRDSYVQQGKLAMKDTMGQAAALTGGYGSTYGQSVGQQSYDAYLQKLGDVVPELYEKAYGRYQDEGDELMKQYALMGQRRDAEYGLYRDALGDWENERAYQTQREREDYNRRMAEDERAYQRGQDQLDQRQKAYSALYALIAASGYRPTDDELNILYTNAKFSILPSAYEGWSLTLPEALGYHKFVLASDVPPLREIGRDLIEYCDTYDPKVWAERIVHYANSPQELARREAVIRKEWKPISWNDCGRQIDGYLRQLSDELTGKQLPTLYFDVGLTTITAATGGKITGILRTELMLLKGIYGRYPNLELFALHPNSGKYVRFTFEDLETVITGSDLSNDFEALRPVAARILFPNMFISFSKHDYYSQAAWFFVSCLPKRWRESISEKRAKRAAASTAPCTAASWTPKSASASNSARSCTTLRRS